LALSYRQNNLSFSDFDELKKTAKRFIKYVITGTGSGDDELLNSAVDKWIRQTKKVVCTPHLIYTDRAAVFIYNEFATNGTAYAASLMEQLCEDELEREIEFYTTEDESAPLRALQNAVNVKGGNGEVEISIDDARFGICVDATPPTELWENMTIRMGFGENDDCNIKVGVVRGKGAVVIKEYFTLPNGDSKWAFFGKGGKTSAKREGLLALVKHSSSNIIAKFADLSSSPIFVGLFHLEATTNDSQDFCLQNEMVHAILPTELTT